MSRTSPAFSRRVLLSQLTVIVVTLALVTGVFAWMAARTVTDVSETEALATARALASSPEVREGSTRASTARDPMPAKEITEPLLAITRDLRDRSGIEFAVITDDRGLRLTHPNPALIGKRVSTSPEAALAGREEVTQEAGTLGSTVRAKVPIYSSTGDGSVVGEVSVGIQTSVLTADLRREFIALGSVAILALSIGVLASVALGRRLRRATLGVGPEELAEMARDQGAVLRGLDDGVLGFDSAGGLTLSNSAARSLLATARAEDGGTAVVGSEGVHSREGHTEDARPEVVDHEGAHGRDAHPGGVERETTARNVTEVAEPTAAAGANGSSGGDRLTDGNRSTGANGSSDGNRSTGGTVARRAESRPTDERRSIDDVPEPIRAMMAEAPEHGALRRRVSVGDRILLATAVRVRRDGVSVGGVITLRDETTMLTMARQLESVTAMAQALRAQRHEFANRLHTVLGLVDTGATDEASSYLESILGTGALTAPVAGIEALTDPYLRALLEAKGTTAAEAGVSVRVSPDSLVVGRVTDPEDVTLVLGNLIDNAVRAAVRGRPDARPHPAHPGSEHPLPEPQTRTDEPRAAETRIVEVQLLSDGSELHGLVTDTGAGVDPADAERIFDEGVSGERSPDHSPGPIRPIGPTHLGEVDATTTDTTAGTDPGPAHGQGLGLALCRRVARRHGGRVWLVDGRDPRLGGASFGMLLPTVLEEDEGAN